MGKMRLNPKSIFDNDEIQADLKSWYIPESTYKHFMRNLIQVTLPSLRSQKNDPCQEKLSDEEIYSQVPVISKKLKEMLLKEYTITTSKLEKVSKSEDSSTFKLLIRLQDGNMIESVIMKYGEVEFKTYQEEKDVEEEIITETKFRSKRRATLCVSSEVGCAMGCTFCATGTMGLVAQLTHAEIIEQLWHASMITPIRNIVFMGMGEPLSNYTSVVMAIKKFVDPSLFAIPYKSVSVSTVGIVPNIRKMAQDIPHVSLAFSLHAPTEELRSQIVPSSKHYRIRDILEACDDFVCDKSRTYMVEYVLIDGVNNQDETAHELGKLLEGRQAVLNVIPYNPTPVPYDYKTPPIESSKNFVKIVRSYGVFVSRRQTLGADASSACGQLVLKNAKVNTNDPKNQVEIEDIIPSTVTRKLEKPKKGSRRMHKHGKLNKGNSVKLRAFLPQALILITAICMGLISKRLFKAFRRS